MSRITLAGLNRISEDHKHNSGDEWTWEDVIFNECLNGNNVKKDIDRMSKKEVLTVLDWAARYRFGDDVCTADQRIFDKIYDAAKDSLMERL